MFPLKMVWSLSRNTILLIVGTLGLSAAHAQAPPCGLTSITEGSAPIYPPIAKIAYVEGDVILMVRFARSGTVEAVHELSGPPMLRIPATTFVKTWQANPYTGPRECPIVIKFELTTGTCDNRPSEPMAPISRIDVQHVVIRARATMICDPAMDITRKRKRFLIF